MKTPNRLKAPLALFLLFALLPLSIANAAGGRLAGKVTDPKGATVAGATVTLTDPLTNQTFTAVTDKQRKAPRSAIERRLTSLTTTQKTGF